MIFPNIIYPFGLISDSDDHPLGQTGFYITYEQNIKLIYRINLLLKNLKYFLNLATTHQKKTFIHEKTAGIIDKNIILFIPFQILLDFKSVEQTIVVKSILLLVLPSIFDSYQSAYFPLKHQNKEIPHHFPWIQFLWLDKRLSYIKFSILALFLIFWFIAMRDFIRVIVFLCSFTVNSNWVLSIDCRSIFLSDIMPVFLKKFSKGLKIFSRNTRTKARANPPIKHRNAVKQFANSIGIPLISGQTWGCALYLFMIRIIY